MVNFTKEFLKECGIEEVSIERFQDIAVEEFRKTFQSNIECGGDKFAPFILTKILSKEQFARFIQDNPDFSNYGDSYEFDWSSIEDFEEVSKQLCEVYVYKVEEEFFLLCF
jgi:hypothetical protein